MKYEVIHCLTRTNNKESRTELGFDRLKISNKKSDTFFGPFEIEPINILNKQIANIHDLILKKVLENLNLEILKYVFLRALFFVVCLGSLIS